MATICDRVFLLKNRYHKFFGASKTFDSLEVSAVLYQIPYPQYLVWAANRKNVELQCQSLILIVKSDLAMITVAFILG